ncbi:MAG: sugar phosphate isomerase/epimerase [Chitinophagaceae bacterium]|nr:sugar phosphate isomerase/epimerase [Chitinophagaceae bacterium]
MTQWSRRQVLKSGTVAILGAPMLAHSNFSERDERPDKDPWHGIKAGVASYTFRKFSVEDTIKAMQRLDLKYVSIKDFHLALDSTTEQRKAVVQKFKDAGITPLSCGNITMKNDEADIRRAFEYARDCGMYDIVCSPDPASMPILDKMVKEFDIRIAIHNHGPEDKKFPSPDDVWKAVQPYDKRVGLCIDIGHTARAKTDPAQAILKYRERLYDLHFKDINTTEPDGETIPGGRGVLDLRAVVKALMKIKYNHLFAIEYEGSENDPVAEVAETVGYAKGLLKAFG